MATLTTGIDSQTWEQIATQTRQLCAQRETIGDNLPSDAMWRMWQNYALASRMRFRGISYIVRIYVDGADIDGHDTLTIEAVRDGVCVATYLVRANGPVGSEGIVDELYRRKGRLSVLNFADIVHVLRTVQPYLNPVRT